MSRLREAIDKRPSLLAFAESLYKRAPREFLEKHSIATLTDIADEVHQFYQKHLPQSEKFSLLVKNPKDEARSNHTVILTAIKDRPFVVDSLSELLRVENIHQEILLHPIVIDAEHGNTSVAYVEIERVDDHQKHCLEEKLTSLLHGISLVTDDFKAMKSKALKTSSLLEEEGETEIARFLSWLAAGGFVFIGARHWTLPKGGSPIGSCAELDSDSCLGLFKSKEHSDLFSSLHEDIGYLLPSNQHIYFAHLPTECPIHRRARLEVVLVRLRGKDKDTDTIVCFAGLLTSQAKAQETASIPLLRQKVKEVISQEEALPTSYDYKEIVSILDSMPKLELLQQSVETLRADISTLLGAQHRQEVRASFRFDVLHRFVYVLVILPRARLTQNNRSAVQHFVEDFLGAPHGSSNHRLFFDHEILARLHFCVPAENLNTREKREQIDVDRFEKEIDELTLTWEDQVQQIHLTKYGTLDSRDIQADYLPAFPEHYRAYVSPEEAAFDIEQFRQITPTNPVRYALRPIDAANSSYPSNLCLYHFGPVFALSSTLPLLENVGLEVSKETFTQLTLKGSKVGSIYCFSVRRHDGESLKDVKHAETLFEGLSAITQNTAEDDSLNYLLLSPGLTYRDISILRCLQHYLWQLRLVASERVIDRALSMNPKAAGLLVSYFKTRFDPERGSDREQGLVRLREEFHEVLKTVHVITHDRVLRALMNIVDSVTRTNFFRLDASSTRIALKIDCSKIHDMPKPRPAYEIFVNAPHFSGVHLRGGKVARGGLRWSERREDYRTEVLGLMKTQMVKNSIIIPVGAKGGFVLKNKPSETTALRQAVEHCYAEFIRSLLEVTDNRDGDEIIPPERTVCYDGPDPYLVVAADKGTATFSDLANTIAKEEFGFWLGDAFASGGSAGYDHKKLGITARGAWEAVCLHFREIGMDVMKQEFSVCGIGDMSGDVFGNGLLCSPKARLIAAFNHKHIFIDPQPDVERSYAERKRLFELPHSQWTDYSGTAFGPGGAVFERQSKEIQLSAEAMDALGTEERVVSGEDLVKIILKAPVDLLWNGGIGTYVKASTESHLEVGDPSNDDVRINAPEVRAKVIGEGGNLGFTQAARIEYSKRGGHINTDAVDNSGGVDLSDIEVNLKILLSKPLRRGDITLEERNKMLAQCAEEVCTKVLSRNLSQAKVLTLGVRRSRNNLGYYRGLIAAFERKGVLDREIEGLPDDEQLSRRSELKAGLSRPALAVIIAYVKMNLYEAIMESSLPEETFIEPYLMGYFPAQIVERFPADASEHPLRREIIATQIANVLVERMGATFAYRTAEETGQPLKEIIAAYLAAESIMNARSLSKQLNAFDRPDTMKLYIRASLVITDALDLMTRWILNHRSKQLSWTDLVECFKAPFSQLARNTASFVSGADGLRFTEASQYYVENGLSETLASKVASAAFSRSYLHIIDVFQQTGKPVSDVAELYFRLASMLHASEILDSAMQLAAQERWDALANRSMRVEFRDNVALICQNIILEEGDTSSGSMERYLERRLEVLERYRANLKAIQNQELTLPSLIVLTKQLSALAKPASEY